MNDRLIKAGLVVWIPVAVVVIVGTLMQVLPPQQPLELPSCSANDYKHACVDGVAYVCKRDNPYWVKDILDTECYQGAKPNLFCEYSGEFVKTADGRRFICSGGMWSELLSLDR